MPPTDATLLPEEIGRFVFSRSHLKADGTVRHQALEPMHSAARRRRETSVYLVQGLSAAALWELCAGYVDNPSASRRAKAVGICGVTDVPSPPLRLDKNGVPHPRHADLVDWPEEREERIALQQDIARAMRAIARPQI